MRRILLVAAVAVMLLAAAQLVLPSIAAQRLRDRLAHSGTMVRVEVDAFPAVELLWHNADRVVVRVARYGTSTATLGRLLTQTAGVGTVDASVATLRSGGVTLRDVQLRKRGNDLAASARLTEADLRAAVPLLQSVQPVASGRGTLTLRGRATLLGLSATVDTTIYANNGNLIVQPDGPLGAFARVTVFSDPNVYVEDVAAAAAPGGFAVRGRAHLH